MMHRNFPRDRALSVCQQRQEPVPAVEGKDSVQRGSLEDTNAATGVVKILTQHGSARPARDSGRDPAQPVVATMHPAAGNEIGMLEFAQQHRQIRRIILSIAIERGDDGACGVLKAGPKRGALTAVFRVAQTPDARIEPMRFLDPVPRAVGAGIIDEDQFEWSRYIVQSPGDLAGQREDAVLFIENGNDD